MKNKYLTSFTALLLSSSLLFSGCSSIRASSDTNTAFRQFTLELFRQDVAANTIGLHYTLKDPSATISLRLRLHTDLFPQIRPE